jgi:hypothetical protein
LNGDGGQDFYDVSNVDGSNLPVKIENNKGCPTPSCGVDLNQGCPDDRLKVRDGNGATIGCLSACQVCHMKMFNDLYHHIINMFHSLNFCRQTWMETTTIRPTAALAVTAPQPPVQRRESSSITISRGQ